MRYSNIWILFLTMVIGNLNLTAQEGLAQENLVQKGLPQGDLPQFFEGTLEFEVQFNGPVADQLKLNEPNNKMQMHLKDGSYIINLLGGKYPKTFMYVNKDDIEYSINMKDKMAYKFSAHNDLNKEVKEVPEARKIDKTAEVNGILCDVYQMKKDNKYFTFFVNDEYRIDTQFYDGKKGAKPSFLIKGLGGRIPLKTIKKQSGLTVMTVFKSATPRSFDSEQFRLPPDFEVKKRDYRL